MVIPVQEKIKQTCKQNDRANGTQTWMAHLEKLLTDYFIVGETHYVHSLHCFLEILLVLLARNGNVTI